MGQRLRLFILSIWQRRTYLFLLLIWELVKETFLDWLRRLIVGQSGLLMSVLEWIIHLLPMLSTFMVPAAIVVILWLAYADSRIDIRAVGQDSTILSQEIIRFLDLRAQEKVPLDARWMDATPQTVGTVQGELAAFSQETVRRYYAQFHIRARLIYRLLQERGYTDANLDRNLGDWMPIITDSQIREVAEALGVIGLRASSTRLAVSQ